VRISRCNTKNRWHSVDAHFQYWAGSVLLLFLTRKAATTAFMNCCIQSPVRLHKIHSETSLTLRWGSFSEWGSDFVVSNFCQERLPVRGWWIAATRSLFNYCTYKTKNRWCSIDTPFQDVTGSVLLVVWTWKAANTLFMNGCNQSPLRLPKMHSQESLTLNWCWFSELGSDGVIYSVSKKGCLYVDYG